MSPRLLLFAGPPCSGKSTVGRLLAERYGFAHLEMDAFRARVLPASRHTREDRKVAYRAMHYAAELLLARGHSVIVNAGYARAEDREEAAEAARRPAASLYEVEFTVDVETAVARNRDRFATHPGLDLTDDRVRELVAGFPYRRSGLMVDGAAPVEEMEAAVVKFALS